MYRDRSAISGLVAMRIMQRMKTEGVLDEGVLPESHPHRLVGIHDEASFIYSRGQHIHGATCSVSL